MEEWARRWEVRRWRGREELWEKVEREGRRVPTWKLSREERGVVREVAESCWRGLERRAFAYISC
jgi:ribosomal protein L39E